MFTLIYNNGTLNKPDNLLAFLEANVGKDTLIQIDCITPFSGTAEQMEQKVCYHLSKITPRIRVKHKMTRNCSTVFNSDGEFVDYLVMWIQITESKN